MIEGEIRNIIFDFDGVIANSLPETFENIKKISKRFNLKEIRTIQDFKELEHKSLLDLFKDQSQNSFKKNFLLFYSLIFFSRNFDPDLNKGIKELVIDLNNKGYNLFVLSNNFKIIIKKTLKKHGILNYFKGIQGFSFKTKDYKFKSLEKRYKLDAEESVFITDTSDDICYMKNIKGIKLIGVSFGFSTKEQILNSKPDYIINSVDELRKILLE